MRVQSAAQSAVKGVASSKAAAPKSTAKVDALLVATIKSAYAKAAKANSPRDALFPGQKKASPAGLKGDARAAYQEYKDVTDSGSINDGPPYVGTATIGGKKLTIVCGDLSDTGSEVGFYDSKGQRLAVAYDGQGQHSGADGIDWE